MNGIYQNLSKIPDVQAYYKNDVPMELNYKHNSRVGEIVIIADIGHSMYVKTQEIDWSLNSMYKSFNIVQKF